MCGFAGFFRLSDDARPLENTSDILKAMGWQLAYRGPDEETFYRDSALNLVFRRLSINDLEHGSQPLWNERKDLMLCVNGEIYNEPELRTELAPRHEFSTHSDSECLVHLFEEEDTACFRRVNGMFAALFYAPRQRRLVLCRDHFGIKPLYYVNVGDYLVFASELKALLAHPLCPRKMGEGKNPNARWLPTNIRDVRQLPGGHYVEAAEHQLSGDTPYWSIQRSVGIDPFAESSFSSQADFIAEYESLLADSVQKQLRSDVPVGLFLSGGYDSSLIANYASNTVDHLQCFTLDCQNTREVGDLEQARRVAEHSKLPLHQMRIDFDTFLDDIDFSLDTFEYYIWMIDAPRFAWEWVFKHQLHRYVKQTTPEIKVILLGQGADEFAGGYSVQQHRTDSDWDTYQDRVVSSTTQRIRRRMGAQRVTEDPWPLMAEYYSRSLQFHNLMHEDRTAAACSIEDRVPFLDYRLVEHMLSIPREWKSDLLFAKKIVRTAVRNCMPWFDSSHPKVAFLMTGDSNSKDHLHEAMVKRLLGDFMDKYQNHLRFPLKLARDSLPEKQRIRYYEQVIKLMSRAVFLYQLDQPWDTPPPAPGSAAALPGSLFNPQLS